MGICAGEAIDVESIEVETPRRPFSGLGRGDMAGGGADDGMSQRGYVRRGMCQTGVVSR